MTGSQSKKILVVEDDELTRESILLKLKKEGLAYEVAANGEVALDTLRRMVNCGVVLLDILLPIRDGFWFLEKKQKIQSLKDIPVVVFSNLGKYNKRSLELGAKKYLLKTDYSIKEIVAMLKTFLTKK